MAPLLDRRCSICRYVIGFGAIQPIHCEPFQTLGPYVSMKETDGHHAPARTEQTPSGWRRPVVDGSASHSSHHAIDRFLSTLAERVITTIDSLDI